MRRIYLAGPEVFRPNPMQVGEELRQICLQYGLEGVFPMDAQLELPQAGGPEAGMAIYEANCDLIRSCDAVIANMTPFRGVSMDVGTAYEIGFADALGRPVFGYTLDGADYHVRVIQDFDPHAKFDRATKEIRDRNGDLIEQFGMVENLMLGGTVMKFSSVWWSFEDACLAAQTYFERLKNAANE